MRVGMPGSERSSCAEEGLVPGCVILPLLVLGAITGIFVANASMLGRALPFGVPWSGVTAVFGFGMGST